MYINLLKWSIKYLLVFFQMLCRSSCLYLFMMSDDVAACLSVFSVFFIYNNNNGLFHVAAYKLD